MTAPAVYTPGFRGNVRCGFRSLSLANCGQARRGRSCLAPPGPGILLGVGLGGFVDGILFHQILQWHHMLSAEGDYPPTTVAGLETNTLWDGFFHAATWVVVAVGIYLLWRRTTDWRWAISGRAFVGWLLVGWGLFNLVEGVMDHHILAIHHVREGPEINETAWDLGFLAASALLLSLGWWIAALRRPDAPTGRTTRQKCLTRCVRQASLVTTAVQPDNRRELPPCQRSRSSPSSPSGGWLVWDVAAGHRLVFALREKHLHGVVALVQLVDSDLEPLFGSRRAQRRELERDSAGTLAGTLNDANRVWPESRLLGLVESVHRDERRLLVYVVQHGPRPRDVGVVLAREVEADLARDTGALSRFLAAARYAQNGEDQP